WVRRTIATGEEGAAAEPPSECWRLSVCQRGEDGSSALCWVVAPVPARKVGRGWRRSSAAGAGAGSCGGAVPRSAVAKAVLGMRVVSSDLQTWMVFSDCFL
ncbi:unnamed protein product, partial [Bubo scandiacus]